MPFQIVSGGNRITLLARFEAPRDPTSDWGMEVTGGTVVLASAAAADPNPLILNRVQVRLRVDSRNNGSTCCRATSATWRSASRSRAISIIRAPIRGWSSGGG